MKTIHQIKEDVAQHNGKKFYSDMLESRGLNEPMVPEGVVDEVAYRYAKQFWVQSWVLVALVILLLMLFLVALAFLYRFDQTEPIYGTVKNHFKQ